MMDEALPARRRAVSTSQRNNQALSTTSTADLSKAKSAHTSDDFLKEFLIPNFDAAAYLNTTLSPLSRRTGVSQAAADTVSLSQLSSEAQDLVSQLNAQSSRLSTVLTQLTDDILRSGSRLAYKVELLRGETLSLSESMNDTLRDDIAKFVPLEALAGSVGQTNQTLTSDAKLDPKSSHLEKDTSVPVARSAEDSDDPEFLKQLQTLTLVRSRLDSVIKVFGDAMEFVFPPSEVSVGSSFLSVSAPDPGSEQQSSEQKGQQVLKALRNEVTSLLKDTPDPVDGIEKAALRVEELKALISVWKGTAEEKGRTKFIESLAKLVEDRHRDLTRELEQAARRQGVAADAGRVRKDSNVGDSTTTIEEAKLGQGRFGLISQLQRLRNGL